MENKYARPLSDLTFKLLFGEEGHEQLTIDFLNSFLERPEGNLITEISFMSQEQTPRRFGDRKTILDISCKDQRGHRFIIEMQSSREAHFDKRAFFYAASLLSRQLKEEDPYSVLQPVIIVAILEKTFNRQEQEIISHHMMCNMKTGKQSIDLIELHFIELSRFNKKEDELQTKIDTWLFFLKNAQTVQQIPLACKKWPAVNKAFHVMERASWSEEQTEEYEREIRELRKNITQDLVEEEEERENLARAFEQGIEKAAINGLKLGLSNDIIKQLTGLSFQQIDLLRASINQ